MGAVSARPGVGAWGRPDNGGKSRSLSVHTATKRLGPRCHGPSAKRSLFSKMAYNDAVKLRSGAVQREANHTEQRLSLSVQPGLPGTTASTACFVHESAGVGHHDSSQKMATGDQQINGTRRAHLACSAATTSWRQTLLSHGRVEATVTQSAAGRFTRELAKKVTVWKESAEGRELHKTTWLSCLPALCNAKRTTRTSPIFECERRFVRQDSFNHMLCRPVDDEQRMSLGFCPLNLPIR